MRIMDILGNDIKDAFLGILGAAKEMLEGRSSQTSGTDPKALTLSFLGEISGAPRGPACHILL